MEKQKDYKMKIIQWILGIMMAASFVFFMVGEVSAPPENNVEKSTFHVFESDWYQILSDGTQVPITVPGECEADPGEWVTITTTLPSDQEETWICVRSMQQELKIYVGDELRKEYSTLEIQPFGKTSTMTYVTFRLYERDAGETLRIEFMTDSFYAGYVSDMYAGEMNDITRHFMGLHAPSVIVAALMFLIGLLVICGCMVVRFFYKRKVELIHLGNAILIASTWLIVESKIRQFFFPSSTIAMLMGFLMIAILPYPFMSYINSVQKHRYEKVYMLIGAATAVNFAVVVALQMFNVRDFFETMTSSHVIILLLVLTMGITIVRDIMKGYVKEYSEVAIGFAGLMVAGVCEIALTYTVDSRLNGIALCVGLVLLLASAALKSVRDLFRIEQEKQRAIAASESKAKFLANMSHEIRTPINTMIGMNELILRENKDATIEEYAYNVKRASQMLLALINDVLDFSKIEAGKFQLVEKNYQVASMLNDVILSLKTRMGQKELELKFEIDETIPSVLEGDEIRIMQILNNLLSNAVKYTEKGSVTFSVKGIHGEERFSLHMSVEDTGIGIKKEDMEKLFDSFERLELTKNRYIEGTGLGLNITKQLVSLMNGTLHVESEYGKGSCFTVQIPQKIVDATAMGKLEQKRKNTHVEKENTKCTIYIPDAQILLVDDTIVNLVVLQKLLKHTHAQLDLATGGMECFEKTKQKKYDLILMDHMMPKPDGIETFGMIRDDEENPNRNTPIVVLTANAIEGMRERYMQVGFEDYLTKPVDVNKLEEMLEKFLG